MVYSKKRTEIHRELSTLIISDNAHGVIGAGIVRLYESKEKVFKEYHRCIARGFPQEEWLIY